MKDKSGEWKNPLLYLFGKGWFYTGAKRNVVCFWIMFIVAECIETFIYPMILSRMMDIIQKDGINPSNLNRLLLLLSLTIVSTIVFWSLHGPARVLEMLNAFNVRANYRKHLMKGVVTLPMSWHAEHHSGDTIDKIKKGTEGIHNFLENSFLIIYAFVRLVVSYSMLVYFSHSAAYIVIIMMIVSVFISTRFDRILIKNYDKLNEIDNGISELIFDRISNITTIIILRVEKLVLRVINKKIDEPYNLEFRTNKLNELKWFSVQMSSTLMTALVLGTYFWQTSREGKAVMIGSVFLLLKYLEKISDLFFQFTGYYAEVLKERRQVANAEILAKDFIDQDPGNHVLPKNWRSLSISDLSFSYNENAYDAAEKAHLHNISFDIIRGQKIAFIGERGSGKTTMLKLIRDLYKPQRLNLSVDGKYLTHGFGGINNAIGLMPQMPEIFATTVRENITFGEEVNDETIRRFTDIACFTDVLVQLPGKLEFTNKEKGVNLSGGQQQCLALARGTYACRDRDIILLDEPTSSLDRSTEDRVYGNIFREFSDKTIISTVHGLHLLHYFDTIFVFKKGEIVGRGTINELLESCEEFQRLYHAGKKVD